MKVAQQIADFGAALERLREALGQPKDAFIRDSAILRFELVFEIAWKAAQSTSAQEGLIVNSPKAAFQAAFKLGFIQDELVWADILQARNTAVHTYHQPLADRLYGELPRFCQALAELYEALAARQRPKSEDDQRETRTRKRRK